MVVLPPASMKHSVGLGQSSPITTPRNSLGRVELTQLVPPLLVV